MINTKFWDDNYTSNLDPIEKLLFLYFLTNTSTNISGVYEIPLKKIANETGVDKEMVEKIIQRFSKDNKVFYFKGWLYVVNFIKNQNQKSPKVQRGIEIELEAVPKEIKDLISKSSKGIDTLSHSNTNTNSNSNLNSNTNLTKSNSSSEPKDSQIAEVIKLFEIVNPSIGKYYGNTTQRKACERLLKKWTVAQIKAVVDILPELNATKYAKGKSITPHQLEENLGYIKSFIEERQKNQPTNRQA